MPLRSGYIAGCGLILSLAFSPAALLALNPHKALTQYTRTVWTQAQGLPQDTIRAIAQTTDGYLWLGTDEGLSRFDGYDFVTYTKHSGSLPSNTITALSSGKDGSLWIGTPKGLTRYAGRRFTTFTTADGLPDNTITSLFHDHTGALWVVAGVFLSRFQSGTFTNYPPEHLLPLKAVRTVYEDRRHALWVAGFGGLVKRVHGEFTAVLGPSDMKGDISTAILEDGRGSLWVAGSKGLIQIRPGGGIRRYTVRDGLPDNLVRALLEDRSGNLWAGTNEGLSRLENGRFAASDTEGGRDWVRSLFEDREGNLWVGMNSGLNRFSDNRFTTYSRSEGFPSDEPIAVHQDRTGRIWVGYHDRGLVSFRSAGALKSYTIRDGLSSNEIFAVREARNGDLLVCTREGLSRLHAGRFSNYKVQDPLARAAVFDALEDAQGKLWLATPTGVVELTGNRMRVVAPGGPLVNSIAVVLARGSDGSIWSGTYGSGLWRIQAGNPRLYTTADGLSSDQIRALYQDNHGTLWIGTFGGGLNAFRDGVFVHYTAKDGLLSDNVAHIEDDGNGFLWLGTTRGICQVAKQQLRDFSAGRVHVLTPANYGVEDGLRSAQCAPGYPAGGGGTKTSDGRLWFPTSRGLAVLQPDAPQRKYSPPEVQLVEVIADGKDIDFAHPEDLKPGTGHLQFRYTAIHLTGPERVFYSYRLAGLDRDWVPAGNRRLINYNSLPEGSYRFLVRATLDGETSAETSFAFEVLPHFYETPWFRWLFVASLVAAIYGLYQLRLKQIRGRFSLVLEERARLAREIHDTLAQGFVGISTQLEAVALKMNGDIRVARQHLEIARKMARHSLTEARRSVMDLRASSLGDQDLPSALISAARRWAAGSSTPVEVDVSGEQRKLPEDVEMNVLRIAQEAVTNALKHADAATVRVHLQMETRRVLLRVKDDGRGFEPSRVFTAVDGHFGILGMRERAERLGGELDLSSEPGQGTQIEVRVPLA